MVWSLIRYHRPADRGITTLAEPEHQARAAVDDVAGQSHPLRAWIDHAGLADAPGIR